uniref:Uncharacterized protein n=1 Tax=Rhizophora mucronata TaxID=61149 RepID=A0A2P2PIF7_RHIMU
MESQRQNPQGTNSTLRAKKGEDILFLTNTNLSSLKSKKMQFSNSSFSCLHRVLKLFNNLIKLDKLWSSPSKDNIFIHDQN